MTRGWRVRIAAASREAVVAITAAVAVAAVAWALDPDPGTIVFALFLVISLSRSQLERDVRGRLEAGIALPLVALAGAGVGMLLAATPWAGALLFTVGVTASVLLRRFGRAGRRLGALVALPFTVLLVAPVGGADLPAGRRLVIAIVIGVVAWAAVTALQLAARRVGLLPSPGAVVEPTRGGSEGRLQAPLLRDATVRLAVQLAAAVGGAFAVGYVFFPDRWAWIVLTALIVSLGNTGRADVAHKAVQRVIGAGVGSVVVFLIPVHLPVPWALSLVLLALFAGLVLRSVGYVWWALSVTVALAVAQSFWAGPFELWQRWAEIVLGAVLAVVIAWVVLPIRTEDVVRRRIADVLAALADWQAAVAAPDPEARGEAPDPEVLRRRVLVACARLDRAAAPLDALSRVPGMRRRPRASGWARSVRIAARALLERPRSSARRAIGQSRRAVREPAQLQAALDDLVAAVTD